MFSIAEMLAICSLRGMRVTGHLYRGVYRPFPCIKGIDKSFPVAAGEHLSTVLASVERNPVRPTLVDHAETWCWSSLWRWSNLWRWEHPSEHQEQPVLCPWPIPR